MDAYLLTAAHAKAGTSHRSRPLRENRYRNNKNQAEKACDHRLLSLRRKWHRVKREIETTVAPAAVLCCSYATLMHVDAS